MNKDEKLMKEFLELLLDLGKEEKTPEANGEAIRKKSEDLGNLMYQSYLGFKDAGFTDEQAFQLVLTVKRGM